MRLRAALIALLLLVPAFALAAAETLWDFRNASVPGDWQVQNGVEATPGEKGLRLSSAIDAKMIRESKLTHDAEIVTIIAISSEPTEMQFVWHPKDTPPDSIVQLPFTLKGTGEPETTLLPVHQFSEWNGRPDRIGIGFKGGSDIILQEMTFLEVDLAQKMKQGWASFWTFDTYQGYSINFLWGPLVTFTEPQRLQMFSTLPPKAMSGLRFFYLILAVGAIIALAWWGIRGLRSSAKRQAVLGFLGLFTVLWLLLDFRMGLELLSYVKTDFRTYVMQPEGQKTFRNFMNFHDTVSRSKSLLMKQEKYGFVSVSDSLFSFLRYLTYPSLPILPAEKVDVVDTLLIFKRPDIVIDEKGTVRQNTEILAQSGTVLLRFDNESFLLRLPPVPDQPKQQ